MDGLVLLLGIAAVACSLASFLVKEQRTTSRKRRNRRRSKALAPVRKARRAARNIKGGVR